MKTQARGREEVELHRQIVDRVIDYDGQENCCEMLESSFNLSA